MDQSATSGNNLPDASSLVSAARKRKDDPSALDAEEVETEVFDRIKEESMSLPLVLQSMVIEWAKELLSQKDFTQAKKISLQNQHRSSVLAN